MTRSGHHHFYRSKNAFEPTGFNPGSRIGPHREPCEGWQGDPYPTTHPYMGKNNSPGPKYGNWIPHPYLTDMDTLTRRFGSWTGSQKLDIEPRTGVGNLAGERSRLGIGGLETGQIRYPPMGLCNPANTVPTMRPKHICKLDLSEDARCPYNITLGRPNPDWPTVSRPGTPWYCTQSLNPEHRPGLPQTFRPNMPAAGVPTSSDCPLAYRYHPAHLNDPNLRKFILHKTLGQFTNPQFRPRPGDIVVLQRPRQHAVRDAGFVEFYTADYARQRRHMWNHGDHLLRLGKLMGGRWKMCKDFKLFKLIEKTTPCTNVGRWMIIGLLEREPRKLKPLRTRKNYAVKTVVQEFWPERGDLLIRFDASGNPSQLDWAVVPGTGPSYRPGHGDVILRVYMGRPMPPYDEGTVAGSVEMFLYDGKGAGWVFMGRDESVIDANGEDLLEQQYCHSYRR